VRNIVAFILDYRGKREDKHSEAYIAVFIVTGILMIYGLCFTKYDVSMKDAAVVNIWGSKLFYRYDDKVAYTKIWPDQDMSLISNESKYGYCTVETSYNAYGFKNTRILSLHVPLRMLMSSNHI
jgi:hypothetical protein